MRQEASMITDLIDTTYRRAWWALVLRGLLGIAVGALILWRPLESVAAFALFIALWAIFNGAVQIVHAFELRPVLDGWWVPLLSGAVGVMFGIAALYYYPALSLAFAVAWVAWWLLFTGGLGIYAAMVERRIGVSGGWTLAFGILAMICGVLAFLSPPATLATLMGLIATFAIAGGVLLLIAASRLAAVKSKVGRVLGSAAPH
jgi:uncharacterized membrane protein HdeD (DUF308 family)